MAILEKLPIYVLGTMKLKYYGLCTVSLLSSWLSEAMLAHWYNLLHERGPNTGLVIHDMAAAHSMAC